MGPDFFVRVIAKIESNDNPNALGDDGLAWGRYQMHACWVFQWAAELHVLPGLHETWDQFFTRLLYQFAKIHLTNYEPREVAMWFHLGHYLKAGAEGWDWSYDSRFEAACNTVGA